MHPPLQHRTTRYLRGFVSLYRQHSAIRNMVWCTYVQEMTSKVHSTYRKAFQANLACHRAVFQYLNHSYQIGHQTSSCKLSSTCQYMRRICLQLYWTKTKPKRLKLSVRIILRTLCRHCSLIWSFESFPATFPRSWQLCPCSCAACNLLATIIRKMKKHQLRPVI